MSELDRAADRTSCTRQPPQRRICQGTLLSREQYLTDVGTWGFEDARLTAPCSMTVEEVAHWTRAIGDDEP